MTSKNFDLTSDEVKTILEDEEEDWTSCWNGAKALAKKFGIKKDPESKDFYTGNVTNFDEIKDWGDGIYLCVIDTEKEMHYFGLQISGNNITLLSTYGGHKKIIKKTFVKKEWVRRLISASYGNEKDYKFVFNLPNGGNASKFSIIEFLPV